MVTALNGSTIEIVHTDAEGRMVYRSAAVTLQPWLGNLGLWLALHVWFVARGGYYGVALQRKRAGLFA